MTDRDRVRLSGVHPLCVAKYASVDAAMAAQGTPIFVVQGLRTAEQQHADWLVDRDPKTGAILNRKGILTYADGYEHKGPHQARSSDGYGRAIDFGFDVTKVKDAADPRYQKPFSPAWPWEEAGVAGENVGLVWGGRFHNGHMGDLDHLELPDAT